MGWQTGETLAAELVTQAWQKAVRSRRPGPGLLHHSDRGVQPASGATTVTVGGNGGGTWNLGAGDIAGDLMVQSNGTLKLGDNGIVNAAGLLQQDQGGVITVNGSGASLNVNSIGESTFVG